MKRRQGVPGCQRVDGWLRTKQSIQHTLRDRLGRVGAGEVRALENADEDAEDRAPHGGLFRGRRGAYRQLSEQMALRARATRHATVST